MKHLHRKLLVPVALWGALMSGAALAQSATGNQGSGEIPRSLLGDAELTERGVTITPPQVDLDEIDRDLILDPEALRDSFGTISRSRDGRETREPASEEVLRTLEGALVPNGDETERQVFGEDDRVQITDASSYPFRAIGMILGRNGEDIYNCSAALIGPSTVLTAAHCLYLHDGPGWLNDFVFVPGLTSFDDTPFGVWNYDTAYIFEGYLTNYRGFYGSVVPWDIAVVTLDEPIGDYLGWLDYAHDPNLGDFFANVIGYPGDKPAGTMWRATCDVSRNDIADQYFEYLCDTYAGTSGSAVYKFVPDSGERTVYGVNVAASAEANVAVRINETYFNWITERRK